MTNKNLLFCILALSMLLSSCSNKEQPNNDQDASSNYQPLNEVDYGLLQNSFASYRRVSPSSDGMYSYIILDETDAEGNQQMLLVFHNNDDYSSLVIHNNPAIRCSIIEPTGCSSYFSNQLPAGVEYYEGYLYYWNEVFDYETEERSIVIARMDLDGTNRKQIFKGVLTKRDIGDTALVAKPTFYQGSLYYTEGDDGIHRVDLTDFKEDRIFASFLNEGQATGIIPYFYEGNIYIYTEAVTLNNTLHRNVLIEYDIERDSYQIIKSFEEKIVLSYDHRQQTVFLLTSSDSGGYEISLYNLSDQTETMIKEGSHMIFQYQDHYVMQPLMAEKVIYFVDAKGAIVRTIEHDLDVLLFEGIVGDYLLYFTNDWIWQGINLITEETMSFAN